MFGYTITECYSEESAVLSFKHFCGRAFYSVQVSTPETQTARFLQGCTTWLARYRSLTLLTLSLFMRTTLCALAFLVDLRFFAPDQFLKKQIIVQSTKSMIKKFNTVKTFKNPKV